MTKKDQWDRAVAQGQFHLCYKFITKRDADEQAKYILDNFNQFEQIPKLSARKSYCIESHKNDIADPPKQGVEEKWVAKNMVRARFSTPLFGELLEYEVPLATPKRDDPEFAEKGKRLGDIDLLSKDGDVATLLELKKFHCQEHPLRAFLEAFTYWKAVGGIDSSDFLNASPAKGAKVLDKGVILYEESATFQTLKTVADTMRDCIKRLSVKCYVVSRTDESNDKCLSFGNVWEFDLDRWMVK